MMLTTQRCIQNIKKVLLWLREHLKSSDSNVIKMFNFFVKKKSGLMFYKIVSTTFLARPFSQTIVGTVNNEMNFYITYDML